jgi:hypothetical protein
MTTKPKTDVVEQAMAKLGVRGDTLARLEKGASVKLAAATSATRTMVRKHPLTSAGVLLGAGAVAGVAMQRALRIEPTVGQVLMKALRDNAGAASKSVASSATRGVKRANQLVHRAMK